MVQTSDCEELKKRIEILEKESEEREGTLLKKIEGTNILYKTIIYKNVYALHN